MALSELPSHQDVKGRSWGKWWQPEHLSQDACVSLPLALSHSVAWASCPQPMCPNHTLLPEVPGWSGSVYTQHLTHSSGTHSSGNASGPHSASQAGILRWTGLMGSEKAQNEVHSQQWLVSGLLILTRDAPALMQVAGGPQGEPPKLPVSRMDFPGGRWLIRKLPPFARQVPGCPGLGFRLLGSFLA